MTVKEEIQKIEGLAEALGKEIEAWFGKHFSASNALIDIENAKTELHETLGTAPASTQPAA